MDKNVFCNSVREHTHTHTHNIAWVRTTFVTVTRIKMNTVDITRTHEAYARVI